MKSFYWELFDRVNGSESGKPFSGWTMWNECVANEAAEGEKADDEESKGSQFLARVRNLQVALEQAKKSGREEAFKASYSDWGVKI
jgi:hypothetical protein